MPIIKKAQVLIVTVFAIIFTSAVVFALLLPILSQLKSWQETTDAYQALANAEAGLELELLNQSSATDTISISLENLMGGCNMRRDLPHWQDHGHGQPSSGPSSSRSNQSHNCSRGKVHFNLKISTSTDGNVIDLRIDSEGISGRFHRTLFLTTLLP